MTLAEINNQITRSVRTRKAVPSEPVTRSRVINGEKASCRIRFVRTSRGDEGYRLTVTYRNQPRVLCGLFDTMEGALSWVDKKLVDYVANRAADFNR